MNSEELSDAVNQAKLQWEELGHPDNFRAMSQTSLGPTPVHIYHHESFPSGGRSFTADVTHPEGGQHLGRDRLHVA